MRIRRLLEAVLRIVGDSPDYFVSGSLSFLPLLPHYREPEHDVDLAVSVDLFRRHEAEFEAAGDLHVLRLSEVAIADASPLSRLLAPRTRFVHIETPDGLIDLSQYEVRRDGLELFLGAGLSLRLPGAVLERVRMLEWGGLRYRAGPPELAILPKALWYLAWKESGSDPTSDGQKHLADLRNASALVDWEFAERVRARSGLYWLGHRFPRLLDRAVNPWGKLDLVRVRDEPRRLGIVESDDDGPTASGGSRPGPTAGLASDTAPPENGAVNRTCGDRPWRRAKGRRGRWGAARSTWWRVRRPPAA